MNPSKLDPYLGKPVEVEDKSAYAQCMDLAFLWCDLNGIPRSSIRNGYAYQVWNSHDSNIWEQSQTPQPGSLVIFGQAVGVAGHIAVMKDAITSYNQNWDGKQFVTLNKLPSTGRLGYLIYKGEDMGTIVDRSMAAYLYDKILKRPITEPEYAFWVGKDIVTVLHGIADSPEAHAVDVAYEAGKNGAGLTKTSVLDYVNKHLS